MKLYGTYFKVLFSFKRDFGKFNAYYRIKFWIEQSLNCSMHQKSLDLSLKGIKHFLKDEIITKNEKKPL